MILEGKPKQGGWRKFPNQSSKGNISTGISAAKPRRPKSKKPKNEWQLEFKVGLDQGHGPRGNKSV
jgi:hypothetical protein